MSEQASSEDKNSREGDAQVGRQRYIAYIYTKKVVNGEKVGYASLWRGGQDFRSLEGMIDQVYRDKQEIRDAVEELANTKSVCIQFFPYPFEE